MTSNRWDDDRLDRLAEMVEANRLQIEANSRAIEANSRAIAQLTSNAEVNTANIGRLTKIAELHSQNFEILIQEIRGLRAENRRILAHLFGEQQAE